MGRIANNESHALGFSFLQNYECMFGNALRYCNSSEALSVKVFHCGNWGLCEWFCNLFLDDNTLSTEANLPMVHEGTKVT